MIAADERLNGTFSLFTMSLATAFGDNSPTCRNRRGGGFWAQWVSVLHVASAGGLAIARFVRPTSSVSSPHDKVPVTTTITAARKLLREVIAFRPLQSRSSVLTILADINELALMTTNQAPTRPKGELRHLHHQSLRRCRHPRYRYWAGPC